LRLWENQQVQNLCLPLLQRFFQKASQNSQVVILFTPPKNFLDKKGLYYKEVKKFFTQIKAHFPFIDPSQNLENKKDIFVTHHYSAQGNQVLALELAQYLKQSEKAKIKTD